MRFRRRKARPAPAAPSRKAGLDEELREVAVEAEPLSALYERLRRAVGADHAIDDVDDHVARVAVDVARAKRR